MITPAFQVAPPDLTPWLAGNTGTEGVWRFFGAEPGRHALVCALVHGNELCGAWALRDWLASGARPRRGTLTLVLANIEAFKRFDSADPHASRCVDTDMNRLWGEMAWRFDGSPMGYEHRRVLELAPFVADSDWLLDLHSMHEPGPALALVGPLAHHASKAALLEINALRVADQGHRAGVRLRDHAQYGQASAECAFSLLVECGFHGDPTSIEVARDAMARFLALSGVIDRGDLPDGWWLSEPRQVSPLLEVTHTVTVSQGEAPRFSRAWRSGDLIEKAGTLVGWNAGHEVRTPYDACVLVMPTLLHARPGATLVRMARIKESV